MCSRSSRRKTRGARWWGDIELARNRRAQANGSGKKQQRDRRRAVYQRRHREIARESDLRQDECHQPYRSRGERYPARSDPTVEAEAPSSSSFAGLCFEDEDDDENDINTRSIPNEGVRIIPFFAPENLANG